MTSQTMAQFNFKFQHVLNIKKHKEDMLQEELSRLKRSLQEEESVLWEMEDRTKEYLFKLKDLQAGVISISEIIDYHSYLLSLSEDIATQKNKLENLSVEVDEAVSKLVSASQEKKIFEKLKERKWYEFQSVVNKQEQEFMDEIASNSHERNRIM